jgi:alkyl sulfatase BDS1-like metallo-beta-lactamase superfamily hydrolase
VSYEPKGATPATATANREAVSRYDMADRQDFSDADRGLIAGFPDRSDARRTPPCRRARWRRCGTRSPLKADDVRTL